MTQFDLNYRSDAAAVLIYSADRPDWRPAAELVAGAELGAASVIRVTSSDGEHSEVVPLAAFLSSEHDASSVAISADWRDDGYVVGSFMHVEHPARLNIECYFFRALDRLEQSFVTLFVNRFFAMASNDPSVMMGIDPTGASVEEDWIAFRSGLGAAPPSAAVIGGVPPWSDPAIERDLVCLHSRAGIEVRARPSLVSRIHIDQ